ncbi:MAG: Crp/Fnr family transcriptional regulator [Campylobacterales bacterium]|nr:Crp/Fnr family transcriptional regulator [Campylobacterales bacterium]
MMKKQNILLTQLKTKTIFQRLEPDDWEYLLSISTMKRFQKDNILFYQGDASTYLHILITGAVKIYKHNPKGHEVVLKEIVDTSLIAQLANLEEIAFPSNCMATEDSSVLLVDYTKFKSYFLNDSKFLLIFIKSLTKRVLELESLLSTHLTLDAKAKVAKFIYENETLFNQKSNVEIAKMLNITPETLSRNIKKLKEEQLLKSNNGRVEVMDREKIKTCF